MSIEAELIQRYGRDILAVNRIDVPPRRSRPRHLLAVIPKAGRRAKLQKEIRQANGKAHVARHRETKEVTTNIVFTNCLPAFAKHARSVLAEIPTPLIRPLYGNRPPPPPKEKPYEKGDTVRLKAGTFAGRVSKLEERKSKCSWLLDIDGKRVVQHIHNMIRIDPG